MHEQPPPSRVVPMWHVLGVLSAIGWAIMLAHWSGWYDDVYAPTVQATLEWLVPTRQAFEDRPYRALGRSRDEPIEQPNRSR